MKREEALLNPWKRWPLALAVALMFQGTAAQAVSLGNVRNQIFVGKAFSASMELGDLNGTPGCITAQLSYGDTPVMGTTFTLTGNTLRVRNRRVIDEPIVNLTVSLDCQNPVTRRYVLLPEAPMISSSSGDAPADDGASARSPGQATSNSNYFGIEGGPEAQSGHADAQQTPDPTKKTHSKRASSSAEKSHRRAAESTTSAESTSARVKKEAPAQLPSLEIASTLGRQGAKAQASREAHQPRLELDNFDWVQKDPGLHASTEMLSLPSTDPQVRAQAKARWAALSAGAGDGQGAAPSNADLEAAQKSIQALSEQLDAREQELRRIKAQIAERENLYHRIASYLLYGVLALVGGGLLLVGWRRWREGARRKAQGAANGEKTPWWEEAGAGAGEEAATPLGFLGSKSRAQANASTSASHLTGYLHEALPLPEVQISDSTDFSDLQHFPEFAIEGLDEAAQLIGANQTREATEDLLDLQQQADFFLALGQQDKAIALLREYIGHHPETSPLAYLDLLAIYHESKLAGEFEPLRLHFNQLFNANVPDFAHYQTQSRGLESYPRALERIQTHWNTPKITHLIEQSVFRRSGETDEEAFAPLAYRELLLLYGIAIEVLEAPSNLYRLKDGGDSAAPVHAVHATTAVATHQDVEPGSPEWYAHMEAQEQAAAQTALSPLSAAEPSPSNSGNASHPSHVLLHEEAGHEQAGHEHLDLSTAVDFDFDLLAQEAAGAKDAQGQTAEQKLDFDVDSPGPHSQFVDFDFDAPDAAPASGEAVDFSLDEPAPKAQPSLNGLRHGHQPKP